MRHFNRLSLSATDHTHSANVALALVGISRHGKSATVQFPPDASCQNQTLPREFLLDHQQIVIFEALFAFLFIVICHFVG